MSDAVEPTRDAWLGGKLTLRQPRSGHRVGSDAALLVAASRGFGPRIVDAGAGVGAVGLALAVLSREAAVSLVELEPLLGELAATNAAENGLSGRISVRRADLMSPASRRDAGLLDASADCVVTNPPFYDGSAVRASPDAARARAHVARDRDGQGEWIRACLALLREGGRFVLIHRPDALPSILSAAANRLGAVMVLPIHPRAEAPAHRLLLTGVKGSRAPLGISPALVLHQRDGALTPFADALHRGEASIDWG